MALEIKLKGANIQRKREEFTACRRVSGEEEVLEGVSHKIST